MKQKFKEQLYERKETEETLKHEKVVIQKNEQGIASFGLI